MASTVRFYCNMLFTLLQFWPLAIAGVKHGGFHSLLKKQWICRDASLLLLFISSETLEENLIGNSNCFIRLYIGTSVDLFSTGLLRYSKWLPRHTRTSRGPATVSYNSTINWIYYSASVQIAGFCYKDIAAPCPGPPHIHFTSEFMLSMVR